jgi:hypothetical protein
MQGHVALEYTIINNIFDLGLRLKNSLPLPAIPHRV